MGETFTIIFKDGDRLKINYPRDSGNPFKARKMMKASIENVTAIEGPGPVAATLRKRYGLSDDLELSDLQLIQKVTGLSKEAILAKKDEWLSKLEKLRKRHLG